MEITEEQLKNMSPEEIRQLQKQQCVFCHIIAGKVQSKKIYEDEKVIAVLDINPANPGHILLMPKEHYPIMPLIPDDIAEHLFMASKALSQSVLKALQAEGTNIFAANGIVAGQKAQHFMIHIIPRKEGDGINLILPERKLEENDMEKIRRAIKKKVDQIFGVEGEEETEEKVVVVKKEEEKKEETAEKKTGMAEKKEVKKETTGKKESGENEEEEAEEREEDETLDNGYRTEAEENKSRKIPSNFDLDSITDFLASGGSSGKTGKNAPLNSAKKMSRISDVFVASRKSNKFHSARCPFVKLISEEHRIYFESIEDARKAHEECECIGRL
ncbi:MAG TPA: HIT domain-containing protein [Candidatus Nanoarchaeia archaeon]|nr:HIT domain-containing protein [Candidatus Nanoarchaeia archaeon]